MLSSSVYKGAVLSAVKIEQLEQLATVIYFVETESGIWC